MNCIIHESKFSALNYLFIYLVFFSFGLKYSFYKGFYVHDLLIVVYILLNFDRIKINFQILILFFLLTFLSTFFIMLNIYKIDSVYGLMQSYYFTYNLFIFSLYLIFFKLSKHYLRLLNQNIILFFFCMPIIVSILMFFNKEIETIICSIYDIEKYPGLGRYAGIFGTDVNSFGFYSSMVFFLAIIMYKFSLVSRLFFVFIFCLPIIGVVLSGMRMGILTVLFSLLLFQSKLRFFNYNLLFYLVVYVVFSIMILYFTNKIYILEELYKRYSLNKILIDINPNAEGNLSMAINYLKSIIRHEEINLYNILIGINPSINYVDSLYIFLVIKYGLIFMMVILLIIAIAIFVLRKDYFLLLILTLSILISIKGIFVLSNYFMFLIVFIIFLYKYRFKSVYNN